MTTGEPDRPWRRRNRVTGADDLEVISPGDPATDLVPPYLAPSAPSGPGGLASAGSTGTPMSAAGAGGPMESVAYEVKKAIVGQDRLLERLLVALLARGHILVEGVPGLAKTLAVKSLAQAISCEFQRVQFTPDLVPGDLLGTRIYHQPSGEFRTSLGPVFTNLLLADEINRAPAKVQSALLEAMQERQVTIARESKPLDAPFLVLATQNPIESEGTYELPEAQVDRFMMKVVVNYPSPTEEFVVVERMMKPAAIVQPVLSTNELLAAQQHADRVYVDPALIEFAVRLAGATRNLSTVGLGELARYVEFGVSPRGPINLILATRAIAYVRGRDYALPVDVLDLTHEVFRHRIVLSFEALADGVTADAILDQAVAAVQIPSQVAARGVSSGTASVGNVTSLDVARTGAPDALLRRLEWTVLRRLDGIQHGGHRSAFRGTGVDVVDLRPYEASDEVRHIDWNVTARMNEPYVREFAEDREITAWLLVDRTPSMTLGPAGGTKEWLAIELAVSMARLLGRGGNRVGAMVLTDGPPTVIRPRAGRRQTLRIAAELLRPVPAARGTTDLARLLFPAAAALRRRSAVFVVSDFLTVPGWERGLQMLARRHDLSAIEVVDRFEHQLPDIGVVIVEDAESGAQVEIDTGNVTFRRRHAALIAERNAAIDQVMRSAGVTRSTVSTTDDLVTALARLVSTREARRLVRAHR